MPRINTENLSDERTDGDDPVRPYLKSPLPKPEEFEDMRSKRIVREASKLGKRRSTEEMEALKDWIVECLRVNGCMSARELYTAAGYKTQTSGFRRCLAELMDEGTVEYLYPDKPRDCRQRICLSRSSVGRKGKDGSTWYARVHSSSKKL